MKIIVLETLICNDMNYFEIEGKKVLRRVYYNKRDGLYIIYKGKKYFESEFSYKSNNNYTENFIA